MDLTDEQWEVIGSILPKDRVREDGRGRPWSDRRKVMNGILWILRTGALEAVLLAVAQDLKECFIDGSFVPEIKWGRCVGKTERGKGTKLMAIADGDGLSLALCTESASPAEVKLADVTVRKRFIEEAPRRLVGDKAYDSDPLDAELLEKHGIDLIAPIGRTGGLIERPRTAGH